VAPRASPPPPLALEHAYQLNVPECICNRAEVINDITLLF